MNMQIRTLNRHVPRSAVFPTRVHVPVLQRKRFCGNEQSKCKQSSPLFQRASVGLETSENGGSVGIPPVVRDVLRSPGQPLEPTARAFMEPGFGRDFSRVRVHSDAAAATSAQAVDALAYAVGNDIVFGPGQYKPHTSRGRELLAHELTHTVQQDTEERPTFSGSEHLAMQGKPALEQEADRAVLQVVSGRSVMDVSARSMAPALQRKRPRVTIRSPVFEETVTQISEVAGGIAGRALSRDERTLARSVFGSSIDFDRVRLIPLESEILEFRTVGNNIYVPSNFSISDPYMAQTLIHELTHVWQYQHRGTSYISESLSAQIGAAITRGSRNFAYEYQIIPGQSFFDFGPEQQGLMVENYFAMQRDQQAIPADQAAGVTRTYASNHLEPDGFPRVLTASERLAEITRELPMHEPLMEQMRAALPRSAVEILSLRAMDVMQSPNDILLSVPPERRLIPVRPLLEVRF